MLNPVDSYPFQYFDPSYFSSQAKPPAKRDALSQIPLQIDGVPEKGHPPSVTNKEAKKVKECQTCKRRKYQDASSDPSVSFKAPTSLPPGGEASAVAAHEFQHVMHERGKAAQEGREVVYQTVMIHTAICPECGRVYVSGGTTTTVTREKPDYRALLGQNLDLKV